MKVVFDASSTLLPLAGVGRYTLELLRALLEVWPDSEPPPTVWLNSLRNRPDAERHGFLESARGKGRVEVVNTRLPGPALLAAWKWFRQPRIERITGAADVVHCPATYVVPSRRAARVVTVHDLHYLRHPSHGERLGGGYLASTLYRVLPGVEAIVVPSRAVREEVLTHFTGVEADRVHVVPEGVDLKRFRPLESGTVAKILRARGLEPPYVLSVATLEPRKNLEGLLKAFRVCIAEDTAKAEVVEGKRSLAKLQLVLVGRKGWGDIRIEDVCRRVGVDRKRVRWFGDVEDEELTALYNGARVVAMASLWEGFGLPALEAMACGTPVLVSNRGALPEVVGDAGATFDPENLESFAQEMRAILEISEEKRSELGRRCIARAREFTWEAAARHTIEVYREAAGSRGATDIHGLTRTDTDC
jgi:glycosyltransferase involved in cell wall biosynthesis